MVMRSTYLTALLLLSAPATTVHSFDPHVIYVPPVSSSHSFSLQPKFRRTASSPSSTSSLAAWKWSSSGSKSKETSSSPAPLTSSSSSSASDFDEDEFLGASSRAILTPEGYGFTSPISRILKDKAKRGGGNGYYRASASESVLDVQQAITDNNKIQYDVALVFDDDDDDDDEGNPQQLLGLFTETDYIQFTIDRAKQAKSEQDSADLTLTSSVKDYLTPTGQLLCLSPTEAANAAIAVMKSNNIRHLLVAQPVSGDRKLLSSSEILGVISMQDVLSLVQRDERLSVTNLAKAYPNLSPPEQVRLQLIDTANELASSESVAKQDILRVGTAAMFGIVLATFFSQSGWLHDHADIAMITIFILGYAGIIFEEVFEFNKAGVALLMSTGLWVTYGDYFQSSGKASGEVLQQLGDQLAEVSDICFFLLAASAIVEVVDAHQGFKVVTDNIKTTSKKELFWIVGFLTFFLSSILNNLTVTIVMVSLLRKLIPNVDDRKLFGAMVVVAANAGGVWTPIGDVTTTMLWINQQLSTLPTITELFLPSIVCLVASLAFLVGQVEEDNSLATATRDDVPLSKRGQIVFWTGIASLLSVPVFNELTGLPPYLAMLTGLGIMWTLTDVIHMGEDEDEGLKVPAALARLDTAGILFFLGILMSIGVLDKSGLLKELAVYLSDTLPSLDIIATVIGLASALIDNVPLVAATMGMYDLSEFGTDDKLWQLIALCAGTGGSILVIGSASGVALMGLEKVDFLWYTRKVTIGATVGYFAGIATYLAQYAVINGGFLSGLLPQAAVAADFLQQSAGVIN